METQIAQKKFTLLLSSTYTVHDLKQRLQFLKLYLKQKLFADTKPPTQPLNNQDMDWLNTEAADFKNGITKENFDKVFAAIEALANRTKSLVIFVPLELPLQSVREITLNLRKDHGENFLTDLKLDPNLIAGAAFVWNGTYKDYSLRAKIQDMQTDILAILKSWK